LENIFFFCVVLIRRGLRDTGSEDIVEVGGPENKRFEDRNHHMNGDVRGDEIIISMKKIIKNEVTKVLK
jgi:hypothetical protein